MDAINEAIRNQWMQAVHDAEYVGVTRTEATAYIAVNQRMQDIVSQEKNPHTKMVLIAVWNGILADIVNAADEAREKICS